LAAPPFGRSRPIARRSWPRDGAALVRKPASPPTGDGRFSSSIPAVKLVANLSRLNHDLRSNLNNTIRRYLEIGGGILGTARQPNEQLLLQSVHL
jgi:hypothetical protein